MYLETSNIFPKSEEFGIKYSNVFVSATYGAMVAYAWLPLYEIENSTFEGKETHETLLYLKMFMMLQRTARQKLDGKFLKTGQLSGI